MAFSARHLVATRANLRIAHERMNEKVLWEEEYGSCHRCVDNYSYLASCKECVNGGGNKKLFKERTRKRKTM